MHNHRGLAAAGGGGWVVVPRPRATPVLCLRRTHYAPHSPRHHEGARPCPDLASSLITKTCLGDGDSNLWPPPREARTTLRPGRGVGAGEPGTPLSALDAEMRGWGRGWALDVLVCVWAKAATQHVGSSAAPPPAPAPGGKSGDAKASRAVSWSGVSEQKGGPARRSRAWGPCSSQDRLPLRTAWFHPWTGPSPGEAGGRGVRIQQSKGTGPCQLPPGP